MKKEKKTMYEVFIEKSSITHYYVSAHTEKEAKDIATSMDQRANEVVYEMKREANIVRDLKLYV